MTIFGLKGPELNRDTSSYVLSRIGDEWSVLIIMMLAEGPMRFNELKRSIRRIS
ncbi:winged helix-turn-helix transcriptional regulator [Gluconobacter thailandicus]|uniref:Helix-turn-helix transcriptional regulator n=1 Tax=Gluconobacter thailandicus TaxID=257438 RepID=A0AAP9EV40_GLUTH|nr:winged helix-turn-helix transcriptional regulator [Gluconobacter thailandicus]QEH96942.1 helix-turn-helix transcriptional regulator [Gluconobacter thailandicus]